MTTQNQTTQAPTTRRVLGVTNQPVTAQAPANGGGVPTRGRGRSAQEGEKVAAYVNMYFPRKNGTRMSMPNIPLFESVPEHAQLIQWMKDNPDNVHKFVARLEGTFNLMDTSESAHELDLD